MRQADPDARRARVQQTNWKWHQLYGVKAQLNVLADTWPEPSDELRLARVALHRAVAALERQRDLSRILTEQDERGWSPRTSAKHTVVTEWRTPDDQTLCGERLVTGDVADAAGYIRTPARYTAQVIRDRSSGQTRYVGRVVFQEFGEVEVSTMVLVHGLPARTIAKARHWARALMRTLERDPIASPNPGDVWWSPDDPHMVWVVTSRVLWDSPTQAPELRWRVVSIPGVRGPKLEDDTWDETMPSVLKRSGTFLFLGVSPNGVGLKLPQEAIVVASRPSESERQRLYAALNPNTVLNPREIGRRT